MMPTYLGQPLYPGGVPLDQDSVSIEGETIREIFFRKAENKSSLADEEILKQYLVYRINAPIFNSEFTEELRAKDLMKMSLDEAVVECLEYGFDPF